MARPGEEGSVFMSWSQRCLLLRLPWCCVSLSEMGQITLLLIVAKTRRGQAKAALHCELRILCSQLWIAKCSVFAAQHRVTNPKLIQYLHCTAHRDTGPVL